MTLDIPLVGEIERRLLVNYRADPDLVQRLLPDPFRPLVVHGSAVVGVCLIRLGQLRPPWTPSPLGLRSENAAHRIAVEWNEHGTTRVGVFIPRRDTDSRITTMVGGRLFPGSHQRAHFTVEESPSTLTVGYRTLDGALTMSVEAEVTTELRGSQLFDDLDAASAFFRSGSLGFSATPDPYRVDGLRLETRGWHIEPTKVLAARSSYFEDTDRFPVGSIELDGALVMRHVPVRWSPVESLRTAASAPDQW